LVPQATTIAMLADSTSQTIEYQLQEIQSAARSIGLSIRVVRVGNEREFDAAFATMAAERPGALFVSTGNYFVNLRERLTALAARHGIPAIYELRDFAEAGGLMTYGPSENDAMRQVGVYTGRILKGAKPADLPVVLPTKYELVINLNAAKALGLAIPPQVLAIADEVIE
jgi:putative ABC transport system substrate-binding protein